MSSMVPKENSYRSDMALAELVKKYPDQVVLGCLYSGVQTPFVKPTGVSAFPPFFKDGYSYDSGQFHYPESPTFPLLSYQNDSYVGRMGSFTVTPYRSVDEIPRWVPLWYYEGGRHMHTTFLVANRVFFPLSFLAIIRRRLFVYLLSFL